MISEISFVNDLEQETPPNVDKKKYQRQRHHKPNYQYTIGEMIYAMVRLSHYFISLFSEHYDVVKKIFYYLSYKHHEIIHYWRMEKYTTYHHP